MLAIAPADVCSQVHDVLAKAASLEEIESVLAQLTHPVGALGVIFTAASASTYHVGGGWNEDGERAVRQRRLHQRSSILTIASNTATIVDFGLWRGRHPYGVGLRACGPCVLRRESCGPHRR